MRYDGLAEWYDEFVRSAPHTKVACAALRRLLGAGRGRCLDLGCGTGIAVPTLADLGWSVVAVDVSADQLRIARRDVGDLADDLVVADAADLPFEKASFDAVVSLVTHTDFEDAAAAFAEAGRVLKPNGRFVYVGPHPCFLSPSLERAAEGPPRLHPGYRRRGWWLDSPGFGAGVRGRVGVNHLPLADFLNGLLEAGLQPERFEEPGDADYPTLLAVVAARRGR